MKAHFYQWKSTSRFRIGEPVETFAKTTTDDMGRLSIDIIVDTGVFDQSHNYDLDVYANANDNYIPGNYVSFSSYQESFSNILLTKLKKQS